MPPATTRTLWSGTSTKMLKPLTPAAAGLCYLRRICLSRKCRRKTSRRSLRCAMNLIGEVANQTWGTTRRKATLAHKNKGVPLS
jgi:hypothetical protein